MWRLCRLFFDRQLRSRRAIYDSCGVMSRSALVPACYYPAGVVNGLVRPEPPVEEQSSQSCIASRPPACCKCFLSVLRPMRFLVFAIPDA
jgi:hypothetical protein